MARQRPEQSESSNEEYSLRVAEKAANTGRPYRGRRTIWYLYLAIRISARLLAVPPMSIRKKKQVFSPGAQNDFVSGLGSRAAKKHLYPNLDNARLAHDSK
ncbi:MAG TPA: hypothetical protein VFF64_29750 [Candidatus Eremiobacteraceae bacterium]|nr:hypothetical protein [Candidatus Eremiobacteraceae bacterium]